MFASDHRINSTRKVAAGRPPLHRQILHWVCGAAAASTLIADAAAFTGTFDTNYDRPGNDYASINNITLGGCQSACDADSQCMAYSFVGSNSGPGTCWLKDLVPNRTKKSGVISGAKLDAFRAIKAEPNKNRPGADYANFWLAEDDPALCAQACEHDRQCRAYTYVPPGVQGSAARCWLKDSKPAATPAPGMQSGIKPSNYSLRLMTSVERGLDRPGNDFYSTTVMGDEPLHVCRVLCASSSTCKAYTLKPTGSDGICWLKAAVGTKKVTGCTDCISGKKKFDVQPASLPQAAAFNDPYVDTRKMRNLLKKRLQGFVGYGFVLLDPDGSQILRMHDGYARHPVTGGNSVQFTTDTPARIGSVSKVITAAAVLHANHAYPFILFQRIGNNMPNAWPVHADHDNTTFRALLQHRGRVPNCCGTILDVFSDEALPGAGKSYSNYGIEIFKFLLPQVIDRDYMAQLEQYVLDHMPSDQMFPELVRFHSEVFNEYVENHILDPITHQAACRPEDVIGGSYLYTMDARDFSYGSDYGDWSNNDYHCAQGAWVMSPFSLARFYHKLVNTNDYVPDSLKDIMMNEADRDHSLGVHPGSWRGMEFWTHNGAHPGAPALNTYTRGGIGTRAETFVFPGGYVAAFIANSPQIEMESAFHDIVEAYIESQINPTPSVPPVIIIN